MNEKGTLFQVRCAAYQRINHPLIMRNGPRSLLPLPEVDAAPAVSRAGRRRCRGTPWSPPSGRCATPQEANQPEQHADLRGAAHEAADGRESVSAVAAGMLPRGHTSPRRARRLGCARESASSAERQGRASSSCPSLRQRRSTEHRLWELPAAPAHPGRKGFLPWLPGQPQCCP